jgi:AH receptor-interacting protein
VELPGEYEVESWQLSAEEKLASVPSLQAEGNAAFAKGDVPAATKKYFEAIARIEQLLLRF